MKKIPVLWFRRVQFLPVINILSFFCFMWNAFVSTSYFRMMLRGFGIVILSFFGMRIGVQAVGLVIPGVYRYAGLIAGYITPVLYTYGFVRLQESW